MRRLALAFMLGLVAVAPRPAGAVAHHEQVVIQKLRDSNNKLIGARVHMVVDPEEYSRVRVQVGKLKLFPGSTQGASAELGNDTLHRNIAAGLHPGYVRMQLGELSHLKLKADSSHHELQEVKFDLHFFEGHDVAPGDKVNIYTTFNNPRSNLSYWHVFGMHDGPVQSGDAAHVHELPTEESAHGDATDVPPQ